ncbi:MAG: hypothetical protein ABEI11_03235 [Haloarculaceae archaeon]
MSPEPRTFALAFVFLLIAWPVAGAAPAAPATADPGGSVAATTLAANDTDVRRGSADGGSTLAASTADRPVINHTYALDRTPGTDNSVEVRSIVEVPDNLLEFTLALPPSVTIQSTDGFEQVDSNRVTWDDDASTRRPTVTYTLAANRRSDGFGLISVETDSYAFVDSGAFTGATSWRYSTSQPAPRYETSVTTRGEGYATGEFAYMGAYTTQSFDGSQSFTYVETAPSSPDVPATDLMRGLSDVGASFDVGERDDRVVLFAPPAVLRLGGRAGDTSLWVNVDDGFDEGDWQAWEVWYHEYVHTRQNISAESGDGAYWLLEGSADYYGGYFAWQAGHMTADEFRTYLATDEHADTRLTEAVQGGDNREYTKGRRVIGALDIRIRQETDGRRTLADVLRRVNSRDVTSHSQFRAIVRDVANDSDGSLGDWLDRYATTTEAPAIPDDVAAAYDTGDTGDTNDTSGPPPLEGRSSAPSDPDDDGLYEDVNGDGDVTPGDATVLFDAIFDGDPAVTDNVGAFDFSGDDSLAPGDATVLFGEAFG